MTRFILILYKIFQYRGRKDFAYRTRDFIAEYKEHFYRLFSLENENSVEKILKLVKGRQNKQWKRLKTQIKN